MLFLAHLHSVSQTRKKYSQFVVTFDCQFVEKIFTICGNLKEEVDELTYEVALEREEKIKEFWRIAKIQESILCQRSRFKWIKEGDVNTKLFHGIVNWRKRSNNIRGSKVDGESCEEPKKN